jgi:hypothetical protein
MALSNSSADEPIRLFDLLRTIDAFLSITFRTTSFEISTHLSIPFVDYPRNCLLLNGSPLRMTPAKYRYIPSRYYSSTLSKLPTTRRQPSSNNTTNLLFDSISNRMLYYSLPSYDYARISKRTLSSIPLTMTRIEISTRTYRYLRYLSDNDSICHITTAFLRVLDRS